MEGDRITELTLAKGEYSYTIKTLGIAFLLRYLLLASWLPKAAHAKGSGACP